MAINPIQFQKGLSLTKFLADYGSEVQRGGSGCPNRKMTLISGFLPGCLL